MTCTMVLVSSNVKISMSLFSFAYVHEACYPQIRHKLFFLNVMFSTEVLWISIASETHQQATMLQLKTEREREREREREKERGYARTRTHTHTHTHTHIPSKEMGTFPPHVVRFIFHLSLTHTHACARTCSLMH